MEKAILQLHFPAGAIPGIGFRCPVCGSERLLMSEGARLEQVAHRVGLYGLEDATDRKLLKTGNSLMVSIDPSLAKAVLGTTRPGAELRVGRIGDRIVIELASKERRRAA